MENIKDRKPGFGEQPFGKDSPFGKPVAEPIPEDVLAIERVDDGES